MLQPVASLPSARRLISSLRDLGYSFSDAVAEIVDNSIEAGANFIQIQLVFDGEDSYLLILDNGSGMAPQSIREAMRFGSNRLYAEEDLGRFGLGLKTSSLSQCDELIVSSRQGEQRARINSFMWSMDHVTRTDRWEILAVPPSELPSEIYAHLSNTVGTVVCWRRLDRLLGYRWPKGKRAEQESQRILNELRLGLGATFHRFLSGELGKRRIGIFVNGEPVEPWDPFCRSEPATDKLPSFSVPVTNGTKIVDLTFYPYLLPTTQSFSSPKAASRAGGLRRWNKHQGFYIYRAGRLLQSGGWCGLRTADEHTKLVRILVDIPNGMDEAFKVNISKMRVALPREIRSLCLDMLVPIIKAAQDKYRDSGTSSVTEVTFGIDSLHVTHLAEEFALDPKGLEQLILAVALAMNAPERRALLSGLERVGRQKSGVMLPEKDAA